MIDLEGEDVMKKVNPDNTNGPPEEGEEKDSLVFYVKLYDPSPQGVFISKRNMV